MRVCLAWLGDPAQVAAVQGTPGPWREIVVAGPGLLLVETDETVSRVYHELKWLLSDDCALLVAPVAERPKARGAARGTVAWLRARLPLPDRE
ncbi:hypothetical protein [Nocardioides sp. MH1]|uniref:hypothetical protein n=1 Tax=Nocardioides sp. MH1 TaxID=3242490 RepID=UPI003520E72A